MKLLFITRSFPPSVGGMQKFASDFYENYRKNHQVDLLANTAGSSGLPVFLLKIVFRLVFFSHKYDVIHFYDAVLSPLAWIAHIFSKAKITFAVNGLDIVYNRFGYQQFMPFFLRQADMIFPISRYTLEQCRTRGIPAEKLSVVPVGLYFDNIKIYTPEQKSALLSRFNLDMEGRKILFTVGRLVKRKGHAWFLEHVMPQLPGEYVYVVAGDGPEKAHILDIVKNKNLSDRVHLLGIVSDEEKNCFFQSAELFVMPNIYVENDQEGFGIVLLEAGCHGLPVVATNIEGIRDVVIDQSTGRLVPEKDAQAFLEAIQNSNLTGARTSEALKAAFGWEKVVQMYYERFLALSGDGAVVQQ